MAWIVTKVRILNCTFIENVAMYQGGALTQYFNTYLEVRDTRFIGNMCPQGNGGAVNLNNFINGDVPYSIIFENVEFTRNVAK